MAATDLFPDALDWDEWLARRAAAAAPHASPSLIAAASPAIAPHCTGVELVRLTAACRELRAVEQLPINFDEVVWSRAYSARDIIRFVQQHGRRFLVPKVSPAPGSVRQHEFSTILSSVIGLREFQCYGRIDTPMAPRITSLAAVPQARSLAVLHFGNDALHRDFADLGPLAGCANLRRLQLATCAVSDLSPLARCACLTELILIGLERLEDLSPLAQLISLRALKVRRYGGAGSGVEHISLRDISPLGRLVALEELELLRLDLLADIQPLASCTALTSLKLTGCAAIEHVRPLAALPRLSQLSLAGCRRLTDVSPLARCSSLETLNLSHCSGLRGDLSALVNECTSLQQLNLRSTSLLQMPNVREGVEVMY